MIFKSNSISLIIKINKKLIKLNKTFQMIKIFYKTKLMIKLIKVFKFFKKINSILIKFKTKCRKLIKIY